VDLVRCSSIILKARTVGAAAFGAYKKRKQKVQYCLLTFGQTVISRAFKQAASRPYRTLCAADLFIILKV